MQKRRDGVSHKMSSYKKNMWHKHMGLISKMFDKMPMMLLPQFASILCTSAKDISYNDKLHLSHIMVIDYAHRIINNAPRVANYAPGEQL